MAGKEKFVKFQAEIPLGFMDALNLLVRAMGGIVFKNACASPQFKSTARNKAGGHHKKVGDALREYREKLGVSQSELSRRTGISQARISHYERSDHRMSPAIAKVLAKALKTDPEALLPSQENIHGVKSSGMCLRRNQGGKSGKDPTQSNVHPW